MTHLNFLVDNFKQMSSYSESKAGNLVENEGQAWVEHNKRQISRIYPGGLRTDSSNYDPVPMWLAGNQIGTSLTPATFTLHPLYR